jgi:hypothetical protein
MKADKTIVNSGHAESLFIEKMRKLYREHKYLEITIKTGKQRTNLQNAALHKYLGLLADALNDAGLDMKKTLKTEVDIPWTQDLAKEYLWRPIQKSLTGLDSTTRPDTKQYPYIYEVLSRHMAEKFGVVVLWPCKENQQ